MNVFKVNTGTEAVFSRANPILAQGEIVHVTDQNKQKVGDGSTRFTALAYVGGGGTGTVTSVGLSLPSIFGVSGSPITGAGTLTATLANQTANRVFAGPASGSAAAPTFRAMVPADLGSGTGASKVLTLDGSGGMDWQTPAGGGLTVNTTPIASGTVGRVLFQGAGNVLQQSANIFWNNTDFRLNLGAVGSALGRLSILSPATTGLAIQVRNSADTGNQFSVDGNGLVTVSNIANGNSLFILNGGSSGSGYLLGSNSAVSGTNKFLVISPGSIQMLDSLTGGRTLFPFGSGSTGNFSIGNVSDRGVLSHSAWNSWQNEFQNGNLSLQDSNARRPTSAARAILMSTVGVPSNAVTDTAQLVALDVTGTAGKAWWHARGEHTGNTDNIIMVGIVYKTTTGDPAYNHEGLCCINTFDLTFRIYANGAWKTIITL